MILSDILKAYPCLSKLSKDATLPTSLKYKIAIVMSKIKPSVEFFEAERQKLIDKYCSTDDSGKLFVPDTKYLEFTKEADDLGRIETEEYNNKPTISCSIELPISAEEIVDLMPFFEFEE